MIPRSRHGESATLDPSIPPRQRSAAFTLVELVLVITVIILILAIAIPALSAMGAEARLTAAQQTIQAATTQACSLALANRAMTAVRFFPGEWDTIEPNQKAVPGGRQHLAIYSYVTSSAQEDASGNWSLAFREYLERAKDFASASMPEGVWAAPLEAWAAQGSIAHTDGTTTSYAQVGQDFVLDGVVHQFRFNADRAVGDGTDLLNADDFLIVCDPQTGIRTGTPAPFHMRANVPPIGGSTAYEADQDASGNWYQRYSFSGVVTYPREGFMSLPGGATASGPDRQNYLRDTGRPFMVHRYSGGLLPGLQHPATP